MKTLLYILIFNFSVICFAQDPRLFENQWYLYKVTIGNEDYLPPNLGDVDFNFHEFTENPYHFFTGYCDGTDMLVTYDNPNNEFSIEDDPIFLIGSCFFPESYTFNNQYFSVFYQDFTLAKNPFSYNIDDNGSNRLLTITNLDGDSAFYGDVPLSTIDINSILFSLYPNPTNEILFIESNKISGNLKIKIFNIAGKRLKTQTLKLEANTPIDVSSLNSGLYFLHIEDEMGNREVKKFIKE